MLLGPAGIGLIGLLQNVMGTASTLAGLGFQNVGTRQIAEANSTGSSAAIVEARRALFWGTFVLAALGASLLWLLREPVAALVFADSSMGGTVGWLALGVALSVATGSASALLTGMRRIGDIARVSIFSAAAGTVLGITAVAWLRERGILIFVLIGPVLDFALTYIFVRRLPQPPRARSRPGQLARQWRMLVRLGTAFMLAGLLSSLAQLLVRALVQRELGAAELGQFQAAWAISMTYIGFVLMAMGTDYYPRLTAQINDHEMINQLVNEQSEVAFILAGPILLGMLGVLPWLIPLLYSSAFIGAVSVLDWQIMGDALKVVSWPLGFVILAAGDGRTFLLSESSYLFVFVFVTWIGLPRWGVEATGIAFLAAYALYLPLVLFIVRKKTQFHWTRGVATHMCALLSAVVLVFLAARWRPWAGAATGLGGAFILLVYGLGRIGSMTELGRPLDTLAAWSRGLTSLVKGFHDRG